MHEHGSRDDLVANLRDMAEGWHHLCKDELSAQATDAANGLENGSFSVKVGHTIYTVDESGDAGHTGR